MAQAIVEARRDGLFRSMADLARRARLPRSLLARLAAADAFRSLGLGRRAALWRALSAREEMPLFAGLEEEEAELPSLPELALSNEVVADYDTTGLSLKAHPMSFVRPELRACKVVPASTLAALPDQARVRVAGLVLVRQQPATAKGTIFVTLEDETGVANLVIWPRIWQRYRRVASGAVALLAEGKIQRSGRVIHVSVNKLEDLSHVLNGMASRSRDFR